MPFNADTYRANQYAKRSAEHLAKAREIKARAAAGEAYDWEIPLIASNARLAILDARLARTARRTAGRK